MAKRPHLIIMRGLPGSKKTDLAWDIMEKKYCNSGEVLSTDDYFRDEYGRYYFVYSQRRIAHEWNQERAEEAMNNGVHPIIIDNTNITRWNMEPYVLMGLEYGYYIKFVTAPDHYRCTVDELHARVAHCGIEKGTMYEWKRNFERVKHLLCEA
ncbi:hypothetical protein SKAU_G00325550 [Synaphobranchus kaupii]|uniref:NEDD4-binding protein 2-like 1 n=1 Tax=Synaphobranchus kaupii TaxID=118154 RepID=A0A9Q1EPK4_SYNKA|nr:hypothetical protein SKAU_G00325550 [Synaphobranchus kaupii]